MTDRDPGPARIGLASGADSPAAATDQSPADSLRLGGLVAFSSVDYPGQLAATVFLQGCPWRCHYCHNPHLIPRRQPAAGVSWDDVRRLLLRRQGRLDAVVFSGGEPLVQRGLAAAMAEVKQLGFGVALHTGAPDTARLQRLLPWLDWVGLDIKALAEGYPAITRRQRSGPASWQALALLQQAGVRYECRTTWHPQLQSADEIIALGQALAALGVDSYAVQLAGTNQCLNTELARQSPDQAARDRVQQALKPLFGNFVIRG